MNKEKTIQKLNKKIDECIMRGDWEEFNRLAKLHKQLINN